MPRQARVVAVGVPHHITHRGNNRQDVFLSDEDRRRYQNLLRDLLEPCAVDALGWCWMTNHIHLVAIPRRAESLARLMMRLQARYTQDFNRRYHRTGHLWHSRFFSCALGPDRLLSTLLYVDRNPVRAGMVGDATDYEWSSAAAHAQRVGGELIDWPTLELWGGCPDWKERLRREAGTDEERKLRAATRSGAPLGSGEFVKELEQRFGRRLEIHGRGRPRKPQANAAAAGL